MDLKAIVEQLRDFDTPLIANTIGAIDPTPAHEYYMGRSIRSVTPSLGPTVGIAVTCRVDSSSPGGESETEPFWRQLEEMSRLAVPVVWVVQAVGSRPEHECVVGDGMAKVLHTVGCTGVVTDGGVRDIAGLQSVPFAAYCRGPTVHHTALRFLGAGEPVELGGITVRPGDMIHANAEGVIRIPHACLDRLPESAARMRLFEHETHIQWRRTDLTVAEKRRLVDELYARHFPS
jgi:4-hydroxy-4-methyl-2-oxoglutarate aldolase